MSGYGVIREKLHIPTYHTTTIMSIISAAASKAAVSESEAAAMIDALTETLIDACRDDDTVSVPRFGSFAAETEEEHIETDHATGRRMLIPPAIRLKFSPGGALRAAVAKKHTTAKGGSRS